MVAAPDPRAVADYLQQLKTALRSFTHHLRSPLSVLSGLIEDLEAATTLTPADIADGKESLQRVLATLSELHLASLPPHDPLPAHSLEEVAALLTTHLSIPCTVSRPSTDSITAPLDLRILLALLTLVQPTAIQISIKETSTATGLHLQCGSNAAVPPGAAGLLLKFYLLLLQAEYVDRPTAPHTDTASTTNEETEPSLQSLQIPLYALRTNGKN